MFRVILLSTAILLLAFPAAAKDLDPGAGDNGVTGGGAGSHSEPSEHPNAEGQTYSSPPSFPWSGGASGKDTSEGSTGTGSAADGGSSSGDHGADGSPDNEHGGPNF